MQHWPRCSTSTQSWSTFVESWTRTMEKNERSRRRREQAEREVRESPSGRLLLGQMAYRRSILAKERARAERREAAPILRRVLHLY